MEQLYSPEKFKFQSPLAELCKNETVLPKSELNKPIDSPKYDDSHLPRNEGKWSGEVGNSTWNPDRDSVPKVYNPENKTWGQILDENNIDGIPFKNGEPDFSGISKGTAEIKFFSKYRDFNFMQADMKLSKQLGKEDYREISKWRDENQYTWHERSDCKTMDLVPSEVHSNIPHSGGVSKIKQLN